MAGPVLRGAGLRRHALLSLVVVVTLTLGMGISAGVFALINVSALRAQVDKDFDSYVRVFSSYTNDPRRPGRPGDTTLEEYLAFRDIHLYCARGRGFGDWPGVGEGTAEVLVFMLFLAAVHAQGSLPQNGLPTVPVILVADSIVPLNATTKVPPLFPAGHNFIPFHCAGDRGFGDWPGAGEGTAEFLAFLFEDEGHLDCLS